MDIKLKNNNRNNGAGNNNVSASNGADGNSSNRNNGGSNSDVNSNTGKIAVPTAMPATAITEITAAATAMSQTAASGLP